MTDTSDHQPRPVRSTASSSSTPPCATASKAPAAPCTSTKSSASAAPDRRPRRRHSSRPASPSPPTATCNAVHTIATQIGSSNGAPRIAVARPLQAAPISKPPPAFHRARPPAPRIHTFLSTSDLHLAAKLKITRAEQALDQIAAMVAVARTYCRRHRVLPRRRHPHRPRLPN